MGENVLLHLSSCARGMSGFDVMLMTPDLGLLKQKIEESFSEYSRDDCIWRTF